jgi:hypothetical protein
VRTKKRSGWKHPLDINRNRRRCEKRQRSASAAVRHALDGLRGREIQLELIEARWMYQARLDRRGPARRPSHGLKSRSAW